MRAEDRESSQVGIEDQEDFSQVRIFWERVLSREERLRLADNLAVHASGADAFIQVSKYRLAASLHMWFSLQYIPSLRKLKSSQCYCYYDSIQMRFVLYSVIDLGCFFSSSLFSCLIVIALIANQ